MDEHWDYPSVQSEYSLLLVMIKDAVRGTPDLLFANFPSVSVEIEELHAFGLLGKGVTVIFRVATSTFEKVLIGISFCCVPQLRDVFLIHRFSDLADVLAALRMALAQCSRPTMDASRRVQRQVHPWRAR